MEQVDVGQGVLGLDKQFLCYDRRNLQSTYTKFAYEQRQESSLLNTTATASSRVATFDDYDVASTKNDLKKRVDVVGLTDRTTHSMCLIAIGLRVGGAAQM
jgi:hypothetical protein